MSNSLQHPENTSTQLNPSLPLSFLTAFPFPVFILNIPIPSPSNELSHASPSSIADIKFIRNACLANDPLSHNSGAGTVRRDASKIFKPVWSNPRFKALIGEGTLLDLLDIPELILLGDWMSGVTEYKANEEKRKRAEEEKAKRQKERMERINAESKRKSMAEGSSRISLDETSTWRKRRRKGSAGDADPSRRDGVVPPGGGAIEELKAGRFSESPLPIVNENMFRDGLYEDHAGMGGDDLDEDWEGDEDTYSTSGSSESEEEVIGGLTLTLDFKVSRLGSGRKEAEQPIRLELIKTVYPRHEDMEISSYLVIQCIPRHYDPSTDTRNTFNKDQADASPSNAFGPLSTTTASTVGATSFPFFMTSRSQSQQGSSKTSTMSSPQSALTPIAGVIDPAPHASTSTSTISDPRLQPPNAITSTITHLFPPSEPIIIGGADYDQLSTNARKSLSDPESVEYLLQKTDWGKTSLGPRERWPQALKTMLSLVQSLPIQATLWWGPELVLLYNEHYASMLQGKHPRLFGQAGAIGYAEIWASLGPIAAEVMRGVPASKEDDLFLFETNVPDRPLEEYYHSWYWVPMFDVDFAIGTDEHDPRKFLGLFNFTRNTTRKVIAERRLRTHRDISDNLQAARSLSEFNTAITAGLGTDDIAKDVPFAILYNVNKDEQVQEANKVINITQDDHRSMTSSGRIPLTRLKLELGGTVGVPKGHRSAPDNVTVNVRRPMNRLGGLDPARTSSPTLSMISNLSLPGEDDEGKAAKADRWPFKEVLQGRKAIVVEDCSALIEGYSPRNSSWGALPTKAILLPICNDSSSDIPTGVLICGINLRRPYDTDYSEWFHQLRLTMYSGLLQLRSVEAERQRAEEMQAMDSLKTNWIASVSHELRLPLTLINGPVDDMLAEAKDGTRAHNLLQITKRNVTRLRRLVDQLMDFSRIEGGKYSISCRPMPISSYTRDLANLFRVAIERSKLQYTVDCEEDNGRVCYIDPDMYEKIALNIIGNALKYCPKGFIHVTMRYLERSVVLQVTDSGVGIPRSEIARIGERFFRVQGTARSVEGSGIGLSLTKELTRLMGGNLELESWVATENPSGKHGSRFTVTLPLGTSHLPLSALDENLGIEDPNKKRTYAAAMVDEALQWNRDSDSSSGATSESGLTTMTPNSSEKSGVSSLDPRTLFFDKSDIILVVDDSRDLRTYLASLLKPYVAKVIEAGDGVVGLAKAREYKPNLILTDIQMPNMDGFALLAAIRADENLRFTPVILLTARAGDGERVEGLLTGAEDYLTKPFQSKELIARASLQVQLGKRRKILEEAFATRLEEVEKRREAAELERKRQELLIDVTSHELRNPTSAIIQISQMVGTNLAMLRQNVQDAMEGTGMIPASLDLVQQLAADEELCQNINSCAQSQSRIADDVLALARINLDMMQFFYTNMNITTRAKEVVGPFALEAKAKGIELVLDLEDPSLKIAPVVVTDPFRLGQVLVNLVSNAMRYSGDGDLRRVTIRFAMAPEPPSDNTCVPPKVPFPPTLTNGDHMYLYISVTDSGPGLAQEDVSLLFKRFSQATRHSNKSFGGSGLGLWISKQIATQMGGRIEVDSVLGSGCTFRFYVRVTAVELNLPSALKAPPKPAPRRKSAPITARVLVVEDNMINQKIILMQLRKNGITCEAANNGQEAVDRLRQVCGADHVPKAESEKPFDVVLLDLEMPVMDGLTAIKIIRSEEASGQLKRSYVVALTGNARQQQIEEALSYGMDEVLIKPYKIEEVLAKISARIEPQLGAITP